TPTPTPTPTLTPTPTVTPTPTITQTPTPATSVAALAVGGLAVNSDAVASGTVTIRATGTAPITATATWSVGGATVHTERVRLTGDTSYTRTFSHDLGERPCGRTVSLTVATTPAAPGGARTATLDVPPCPTTVTGLRVALGMAPAPGSAATARIRVLTSGTAAVPVRARFAINGDPVGTKEETLSGRTSYARSLGHAFANRPCDSTVSVLVTAGDRQATARTRVTCPPGVRKVSIVRAALSARGSAVAVVAVATVNDRPVRLNVSFSLAGGLSHTEQLTLSGDTAYTRTLSHVFGKVPCGATWQVRASSVPRAGNGGDSASGRTPDCPPQEEEPDPVPSEPGTDEGRTEDPPAGDSDHSSTG
ncbi:hypothetical protein, partial [Nonomuraea lactucae]|uniref:hypothetical protein n=1 Tax=Nonomuraea lactucae TaxID=2249762 RepID=UPI0019649716